MECFAFGGATVRFASLKTSFHAANHTIPPPPSHEGSPHCPKAVFLCFLFLPPLAPLYFSTEPKYIFTTKNIKYET
ncbi:MAG: hypothetical protein KIG90_10365 [Muribaculaceae bacterium]|nr:hypothetical protein [Muribaculaceae bacterium]